MTAVIVLAGFTALALCIVIAAVSFLSGFFDGMDIVNRLYEKMEELEKKGYLLGESLKERKK